jgi:hypothetical protein
MQARVVAWCLRWLFFSSFYAHRVFVSALLSDLITKNFWSVVQLVPRTGNSQGLSSWLRWGNTVRTYFKIVITMGLWETFTGLGLGAFILFGYVLWACAHDSTVQSGNGVHVRSLFLSFKLENYQGPSAVSRSAIVFFTCPVRPELLGRWRIRRRLYKCRCDSSTSHTLQLAWSAMFWYLDHAYSIFGRDAMESNGMFPFVWVPDILLKSHPVRAITGNASSSLPCRWMYSHRMFPFAVNSLTHDISFFFSNQPCSYCVAHAGKLLRVHPWWLLS